MTPSPTLLDTCAHGVLMGRFQLFTKGHERLMEDAAKRSKRLAMLVGSANRPRTPRNPFTFDERRQMIAAAYEAKFGLEAVKKLDIVPLADSLYDNAAWVRRVQHIMSTLTAAHIRPSIGLFGHVRDYTSDYLNDFPRWKNLLVVDPFCDDISATVVRDQFFAGRFDPDAIRGLVPDTTIDFLLGFRGQEAYAELLEDRATVVEYRKKYGMGPHQTADAVVHRSGHLLLVKRSKRPGKGLWALPGGFLDMDKNETLYQCAIRELREETTLDRDFGADYAGILKNAFRGKDTFDDPNRDERARIITAAYAFDLGSGALPYIEAKDDADAVDWVPLNEIRADEMFGDHAFVISKMLDQMKLNQI